MTEFEMLDLIKAQCKVNEKIIVKDYISFLNVLDELVLRGCINLEYKRDYAVITYLKYMPENAVGTINENDPTIKRIFEMLKQGLLIKHIAKELHVSMNKISECRRYLTNKEAN